MIHVILMAAEVAFIVDLSLIQFLCLVEVWIVWRQHFGLWPSHIDFLYLSVTLLGTIVLWRCLLGLIRSLWRIDRLDIEELSCLSFCLLE